MPCIREALSREYPKIKKEVHWRLRVGGHWVLDFLGFVSDFCASGVGGVAHASELPSLIGAAVPSCFLVGALQRLPGYKSDVYNHTHA